MPDAPPRLTGVRLDHVAVAVSDLTGATHAWSDLGSTMNTSMTGQTFSTTQLRLGNAGKVELIGAGHDASESFIQPFLRQFGPGSIHHLTLKVPAPLGDAIKVLRLTGLDVVDVDTSGDFWHESFLRPSQVGGVIIQVAHAFGTDEEYARREGAAPPAPVNPSAPALEAVVLGHPTLAAAARLWTMLGAQLDDADGTPDDDGDGTFVARFEDSPIAVEVRHAERAGPIGLRLAPLPADTLGAFAPTFLTTGSSR